MPNAFDFSVSPFDCLTADERQLVRDHVDIAYFREGDVVLEPGLEPSHLFIVIKGHVRHADGDEVLATCPSEGFAPAWLRRRGLDWAADLFHQHPHHHPGHARPSGETP